MRDDAGFIPGSANGEFCLAGARDDFFPRAAVDPDQITGLDTIVKDAVALKFTSTELTKAQLDELIQIPPP
jgi:hypothetical protein